MTKIKIDKHINKLINNFLNTVVLQIAIRKHLS